MRQVLRTRLPGTETRPTGKTEENPRGRASLPSLGVYFAAPRSGMCRANRDPAFSRALTAGYASKVTRIAYSKKRPTGHMEALEVPGKNQFLLGTERIAWVVGAETWAVFGPGSSTTTVKTPAWRYSVTFVWISRHPAPGERTSTTSSGISLP